ncbi:TadE/TadG family type IV pilus assembly protein [Sphingobium mellinum]|uniref:TadE/TadG family type IV pilus assembly protein n=1 Tax=Sphingobium mellinum TaxID=1387166 RepID=UPI0030EF3F6D
MDQSGSSVLEFALVAPALFLLIIGGIYLSLLGYTVASLHYATQVAARCASLDATNCGTATGVSTFAQQKFSNFSGGTATFNLTTPACGYNVASSLNYNMNIGVKTITIPINSQSCFP